MDNQQIREILENLMKERNEHPIANVVSQDTVDQLIEAYYKNQNEKDNKS